MAQPRHLSSPCSHPFQAQPPAFWARSPYTKREAWHKASLVLPTAQPRARSRLLTFTASLQETVRQHPPRNGGAARPPPAANPPAPPAPSGPWAAPEAGAAASARLKAPRAAWGRRRSPAPAASRHQAAPSPGGGRAGSGERSSAGPPEVLGGGRARRSPGPPLGSPLGWVLGWGARGVLSTELGEDFVCSSWVRRSPACTGGCGTARVPRSGVPMGFGSAVGAGWGLYPQGFNRLSVTEPLGHGGATEINSSFLAWGRCNLTFSVVYIFNLPLLLPVGSALLASHTGENFACVHTYLRVCDPKDGGLAEATNTAVRLGSSPSELKAPEESLKSDCCL